MPLTPRPRRAGALALVLALVLALGACRGEPQVELPVEDGDGEIVEPGASVVAEGAARADSTTGTLRIEGTDEQVVFRLFRSGPGFAPAFSAYLPDPFRHEPAGPDTVRFRMGPGDAVFEVIALPPGTSIEAARREARRIVGAVDAVEAAPLVPGALLTILGSERDGERTTRGDLVREGDRMLLFLMRYPPEYGDGIGPRAEAIRETWVWSDGGEALVLRDRAARDPLGGGPQA